MELTGARFDRRRFFGGAARLGLTAAGLSVLASCRSATPPTVSLDAPPETTRLRVVQAASVCVSPLYLAHDLLRSEGFVDLEYTTALSPRQNAQAVASGAADFSWNFNGTLIQQIEAGAPVVVLAGAHVGCFELFGTERIRGVRDLKGRTVAIPEIGSGPHVFLASMLSHVGLDPRVDVTWAVHSAAESIELLRQGKVDGYLGLPPEPQQLRANGIGHVVVNSLVDRPWSQYFCCLVVANRDFAERHPVATARALRASLAAVDRVGREPELSARYLFDKGYTPHYHESAEALSTINAAGWPSEYDAEDTVRYYSLRMHEAGMIKSTPEQIISRGTDWRFLAAVKRDRASRPSAAFFCPLPGSGA